MTQGANVRSVAALAEFKNGLIAFADDARVILDGVDMEVRRTRNWLERDQLVYWKSQVKKRQEEVAMARTELHRRKLSQQNSDVITDTEQRENLKAAQRKLQEAEEKVEICKKWIPVLDHAIAEYRAHVQPLGDHLAGGFENTLALIDRMVDALEAYLRLAAPSAPELPPLEGDTGVSGPGAAGLTSAAQPVEESAESTEPEKTEAGSEETNDAVSVNSGHGERPS
jgi:hypothetical protein